MCLLVIGIDVHPMYKVILAANRDEFYDRPTAQARFWEEAPDVLGGKDLQAGGTWLGITRQGRIAAITNYRDPASVRPDAPTRGELVKDFLLGQEDPEHYMDRLARKGGRYNGFNLIVGQSDHLYWYSNRGGMTRKLERGIHALSNHLLNTPWPKVIRAKAALERILAQEKNPSPEVLFGMLSDRSVPDDRDLPETGVTFEWERMLSPVFIASPTYGTRSSTVLLMNRDDHVTFMERTFDRDPDHPSTIRQEFRIIS
jgi:uncharacterized protein with NRDE domain